MPDFIWRVFPTDSDSVQPTNIPFDVLKPATMMAPGEEPAILDDQLPDTGGLSGSYGRGRCDLADNTWPREGNNVVVTVIL